MTKKGRAVAKTRVTEALSHGSESLLWEGFNQHLLQWVLKRTANAQPCQLSFTVHFARNAQQAHCTVVG